jgi:hypothetical protein
LIQVAKEQTELSWLKNHMQRLTLLSVLFNSRLEPEASSLFVQNTDISHYSKFLHFVPEDRYSHLNINFFVSRTIFPLSDCKWRAIVIAVSPRKTRKKNNNNRKFMIFELHCR